MKNGNTVKMLGVNISSLNFTGNVDKAASFLTEQDNSCPCRMIFTPNPEMLMCAHKDRLYKKILNKGDLVVADGIGIVIASRIIGQRISERTPGIDLITALLDKAGAANITAYFLGGADGVAEKAAKVTEKRFGGIRVVGYADGYFIKKSENEVFAELAEKKPDILLVGIGFPAQEKWIYHNKNKLCSKVAIGCGGTLDVLAGNVRRAPAVMRRLGLEWLYRLVTQPKRIIRMLKLPVFLVQVTIKRR